MADDQKQNELIKIEDKSKIIVRDMKESDIDACDALTTKAFGFTKKFATVNQYVNEVYVAEYDGKILGFAVAVHYGMLGALGVLPEYQKNGIGYKICEKLTDSLKEKDTDNKIKRDVLCTAIGTYHIGFYMRFGFIPKTLTYIATFDISKDYDALIKNKDDLLNAVEEAFEFKDVFNKMTDDSLNEYISACQGLTDGIYKGLDVSVDINGFAKAKDYKFGRCVGVYNKEDKDKPLCGMAILTFGKDSAIGKEGRMKIKFSAATDYQSCAILLYYIVEYAKEKECNIIEGGVNMGRVNTFSIMVEKFGFSFDATKPLVSMGRCIDNDDKYDDYNQEDMYIIGDWRR